MTTSLYRRIEASERFAQDVAHELKNPLTAARSTAEALAYAKTPEQREELVRQIQEELKRLNKLITDVSNASRLDAELAYGETEPVDMREVLHGVMDIFQESLQHGYPKHRARHRGCAAAIRTPSSCRATRRAWDASSPICSTMPSRSRRTAASLWCARTQRDRDRDRRR